MQSLNQQWLLIPGLLLDINVVELSVGGLMSNSHID